MRNSLIGRVFGRLLVIGDLPHKHGNAISLCKCSCGNNKAIYNCNLLGNFVRSCGCIKKEGRKKKPYLALYNYFLRRAAQINRKTDIEYEDFLEFTKIKKCHYCNTDIVWSEFLTRKSSRCYYLDRIDNTKDYLKDNCVVCCTECNYGKGSRYSYKEWKAMAQALKKVRYESKSDTSET